MLERCYPVLLVAVCSDITVFVVSVMCDFLCHKDTRKNAY